MVKKDSFHKMAHLTAQQFDTGKICSLANGIALFSQSENVSLQYWLALVYMRLYTSHDFISYGSFLAVVIAFSLNQG